MIVVRNLTKNFYDDHSALLNISFSTEERPFVVVGEEGAGKSTLLNILAGLDLDYEGTVLINGVDRKAINNQDLKISYITKNPVFLDKKSVYDNLKYVFKVEGLKLDKKEIVSKIKEVCDSLNLVGLLDKKIKKLNIFEKRLVAVARAVLKKSTVWLVDEPFFDLNSFEVSALWQALFREANKLSSDLIIADNGQNTAYFEDCEILKLNFGTIIE